MKHSSHRVKVLTFTLVTCGRIFLFSLTSTFLCPHSRFSCRPVVHLTSVSEPVLPCHQLFDQLQTPPPPTAWPYLPLPLTWALSTERWALSSSLIHGTRGLPRHGGCSHPSPQECPILHESSPSNPGVFLLSLEHLLRASSFISICVHHLLYLPAPLQGRRKPWGNWDSEGSNQ